MLRPRSVAVVGASRRPGTIGHEIVATLVRNGFTGPVFPVNPRARSICAIPALPSLHDHPDILELDVNPLLALEHGCVALDARVTLAAATAP